MAYDQMTNQELADAALARYQALGQIYQEAASRKSQLSQNGQDAFEALRMDFIGNRLSARAFVNTHVPDATIQSGAC